MGSPGFAASVLKALAGQYPVVGVVTQPDKPAGRGRVLSPSAVKTLAQELGLPVIQPNRLREPGAFEQIQAWAPDLIVVAAFGQILRSNVLNLPRFGCINVHGSLLPRWRGAAPIQAAILHGDAETGITIMRMDEGIDTGPMLAKRSIPIPAEITAGELSGQLAEVGAALLLETLPGYQEGKIEPRPQPEEGATYAPMLKKEDGLIDFTLPAADLARKVRAFNPWPGAYTLWQDQILKIHRAHAVEEYQEEPGRTCVVRRQPGYGTGRGILLLDEVQPAGKKPMPGPVFLQGARGWGFNPMMNTIPRLRFLVFGAGAIGTYIGGSLALLGQQVVFTERPEVAALLSERGIRLCIGERQLAVPNPIVTASIDEALTRGPFDAAIFAVKAYDTAPALVNLAPYAVALPPVICFQNGVENEDALRSVLGGQKVIAGSVTTAVGRQGPGDVIVERKRGIGIAGSHLLTPALLGVFNAAGLNARHYPNEQGMKWSKMVTNLLANANAAILDWSPAQIFADPRVSQIEIRQVREALKVMDALHLRVVDLPGTPIRALAFLIRYFPPALARPLLAKSVGEGRGGKMPSFHIDLHLQRGKSEVDFLNGAVVRFGERCAVRTPVNRILTETLTALTENRFPLDTYANQPEKFVRLFS